MVLADDNFASIVAVCLFSSIYTSHKWFSVVFKATNHTAVSSLVQLLNIFSS